MYKSYREKIDCFEKAVVIFAKNKEYDTSFLKCFDIPIFVEDDYEIRKGVGLFNESCIVYGCPNITILRGEFKKTLIEVLKNHVPFKTRKSDRLAKNRIQ
tara:strand:- start:1055 stop:1354 length:300 start_codon:yes stop_codon:yes gene_type:complete